MGSRGSLQAAILLTPCHHPPIQITAGLTLPHNSLTHGNRVAAQDYSFRPREQEAEEEQEQQQKQGEKQFSRGGLYAQYDDNDDDER